MTPGLTRSRQSDVHEKGVGCVARSDIDPPYGKASSATPVSGARKRAPRRVRRSRSKAQAASRLRALTGEETNSSRSQGAAMAIGSNPLRSTILSMTYRDGQRIEVHPVVRLTLLDRLRTHEGSKGVLCVQFCKGGHGLAGLCVWRRLVFLCSLRSFMLR